jgi:hypothetical protein
MKVNSTSFPQRVKRHDNKAGLLISLGQARSVLTLMFDSEARGGIKKIGIAKTSERTRETVLGSARNACPMSVQRKW